MTLEQIQQLLHQALDSQPPWYLTILLAAVVGSLVAYFGPYLGEKAKIRALQEDVSKLVEQVRHTTRATEDIKAQIAGGLWVEQKRWDLKRDIYSRLLECLGEFVWCGRNFGSAGGKPSKSASQEIGSLYREIVRAHSVGRIFLSSRAFELISLFAERREWGESHDESNVDSYHELQKAALHVFFVLAEEAGADLMALELPMIPQEDARTQKREHQ